MISVGSTLRYSGIAAVISSDRIAEWIGDDRLPPFWRVIREQKFAACATIWFVLGTITENLKNTGAFEVYYDGDLVSYILPLAPSRNFMSRSTPNWRITSQAP